jgi:hypothetical protein
MTPEMKEHLKNLALSGAISGAVLGGGGKAITGAKNVGQIVKAALAGSALSGGLTLGGGGLGMMMMGEPDENDPTAFTKRSAVGGALAGGALGAGMMSPAFRNLVLKGAKALGKEKDLSEMGRSWNPKTGEVENILLHKLKKLQGSPAAMPAGAAIGSLVGGYQGGDEGMQADFARNLTRARQAKKDERVDTKVIPQDLESMSPETKARLLQRLVERYKGYS